MHKVMIIGGCLVAATAIYAVGQVVSAQAQPAPAAAGTRIAVVNIEALLQNYKRAQIYKADVEKELQPLKAQAEALKKKIMERQSELKVGNFDAVKRKQWEEASNKDMKKLEELEREAALVNNRKVEKELVPIYKEILEAIKAHARSNAIQVVLSYAEDPKIDPFSLASIGRKVSGLESTGFIAPFYIEPAADITAALADVLNQRYNASQRTPK